MDYRTNDMLANIPSTSAFALAQESVEAEKMAYGVNTTTDTSATIDQPSPEFLQRKLYFLLEHLKKMHSELPE